MTSKRCPPRACRSTPRQGRPAATGCWRAIATRLTGLTADEAESLFLTGLPEPAAELGLGAQVAAAELKLTAALPTPYRDASTRIRQRFHLDAPGWYSEAEPVPWLTAVAEALWRDRVIEVRYRRWSPEPGVVTRRPHPLGLVLKAGAWYLIASRRNQPRTYKVASIQRSRTLPEKAERPEGFELAAFWRAHVEGYEGAEETETALIRLSPQGIAALPDVLGPRAARLARRTLTGEDAEGWRRARIPLESVSHAAAGLLKLGLDAQALEPAALVTRLTETVRSLARLYPGG